MALINCPDCDKEVSDQAPTCPNCGRPLKKASNSHQNVKVEGKSEGCFLQTLNVGCIIFFIIIGLFILIGIIATITSSA